MGSSTQGGAEGSIEVRLLRGEDDLAACGRLVSEVFGVAPAAVADWFAKRLVDNPWQRDLAAPGVVAIERGEVVAFRGLFAQRWWLEGAEHTLAWAANTCMPESMRGRGLGTRMIDAGGACAPITGSTSAGLGTQPIYRRLGYVAVGVDNDVHDLRTSLVPALTKRLGTALGRLAGTLADTIRPLPFPPPRGWRLEAFERADARFDALWFDARAGWTAARVRNAAALNQRLLTHATQRLHRAALTDPAGRLRAFAVWHVQRHAGGVRDAVLRDAFTAADDRAAIEALLGLLIRRWRSEGIARATIEVANPLLTPLLERAGFEHRPSRGVRYQILARPALARRTFDGWFRSALDGDYLDLADPTLE